MRRDFGADSLAYSSQPPQNQVDWQYRESISAASEQMLLPG